MTRRYAARLGIIRWNRAHTASRNRKLLRVRRYRARYETILPLSSSQALLNPNMPRFGAGDGFKMSGKAFGGIAETSRRSEAERCLLFCARQLLMNLILMEEKSFPSAECRAIGVDITAAAAFCRHQIAIASTKRNRNGSCGSNWPRAREKAGRSLAEHEYCEGLPWAAF